MDVISFTTTLWILSDRDELVNLRGEKNHYNIRVESILKPKWALFESTEARTTF